MIGPTSRAGEAWTVIGHVAFSTRAVRKGPPVMVAHNGDGAIADAVSATTAMYRKERAALRRARRLLGARRSASSSLEFPPVL